MLGLILTLLLIPETPALAPQWKVGQEYLFRGTVKETGQSKDIQVLTRYTLEVRVLVTRVKSSSAEIVCCTKLIQQNVPKIEEALSVHLTHAMVDARGNITSCTAPTGMPLIVDGPATWESGFLLPLPHTELDSKQSWEVSEPGRLPRRFTLTPVSDSSTTQQLVTGKQESVDWQRPRGDSTAWQRTDKLFFNSKMSLPIRVERLVERRAPAHRNVTSRIITEYVLHGMELLQGPMLEERLRDIQQIKLFQEEVATLSSTLHDREARIAWQRLAKRLTAYQATSGNTPFRESLTTLYSTIQAGIDNRLSLTRYEVAERSIEIGQFVPPFSVVTTTGQTITSQQCRGKPCLLIFVQPGSELTNTLSNEVPLWQRQMGTNTFSCLFLATQEGTMPTLTEQPGTMLKAASGKSLIGTMGVSTTPHFILLDADGTLLASHVGWGQETRRELNKLLKNELAKARK